MIITDELIVMTRDEIATIFTNWHKDARINPNSYQRADQTILYDVTQVGREGAALFIKFAQELAEQD